MVALTSNCKEDDSEHQIEDNGGSECQTEKRWWL